ncbi:MAG: PAS domain-containing protein, partial [Trebonia sp.]
MSTDTSVPYPRISGLDAADSALLETLLKEAPIGFAFFGGDLRCRRINRTLADICGIEPKKHIGRRPTQIWPSAIAEGVETTLQMALDADHAVQDVDQRIAPASGEGSPRHWAFSSFPAHDADGAINGVVLIAVDINDRQLTEEAVRRSEERYRSLVQASSQVVWVTDPDGQVREDSEEWRAITGQSLEEYTGEGWMDAVHPEDRERIEQAWHEAVRAGE